MPVGVASTRPANAPERSAANPRTRQRAKGSRSGEGGKEGGAGGSCSGGHGNAFARVPRFPVERGI